MDAMGGILDNRIGYAGCHLSIYINKPGGYGYDNKMACPPEKRGS
jgi:hypothetical protein